MSKINVYQISPKQTDITSFYRGVGPYGKLAQQYKDLDIRYSEKLEVSNIFWCDVFVMQRPFTAEHLNWIQTAKQLGKPVIVDYDDDVTHVPLHNPHQAHYNSEAAQFAIKTCIQSADLVQVSSEALKEEFQQYNSNIVIVPNALDPDVLSLPKLDWMKRRALVLWRGGESHTNDLIQFQNQLRNVVTTNPNWLFEFFGGDERFMQYILKPLLPSNTHFSKTQSMLQYLKTIKDMAPSLLIVPLENDKFNQAKSNIAWIEGTMVGAVAVAPDMPEWRKPGVITYKDKDDFETKVNYILDNPSELKANWDKSYNHIQNHLLLKDINKVRYELIKQTFKA